MTRPQLLRRLLVVAIVFVALFGVLIWFMMGVRL